MKSEADMLKDLMTEAVAGLPTYVPDLDGLLRAGRQRACRRRVVRRRRR